MSQLSAELSQLHNSPTGVRCCQYQSMSRDIGCHSETLDCCLWIASGYPFKDASGQDDMGKGETPLLLVFTTHRYWNDISMRTLCNISICATFLWLCYRSNVANDNYHYHFHHSCSAVWYYTQRTLPVLLACLTVWALTCSTCWITSELLWHLVEWEKKKTPPSINFPSDQEGEGETAEST